MNNQIIVVGYCEWGGGLRAAQKTD